MKKMLTSLALVAAVLFALPVGADNTGEQPDIVDTAVAAGSFNTLVAAVQAAGLVDALKADGPFTVFAPTDEAFAKLPEGTVESLLEDKDALRDVLTYHVVPGRVLAEDLAAVGKKTFTVKTAEGTELTVSLKKDGTVMVDGAKVGFKIPDVPGDPTFEGTLSEDGNEISGAYTQSGATVEFKLTRTQGGG